MFSFLENNFISELQLRHSLFDKFLHFLTSFSFPKLVQFQRQSNHIINKFRE